jgi:hypothetical protein
VVTPAETEIPVSAGIAFSDSLKDKNGNGITDELTEVFSAENLPLGIESNDEWFKAVANGYATITRNGAIKDAQGNVIKIASVDFVAGHNQWRLVGRDPDGNIVVSDNPLFPVHFADETLKSLEPGSYHIVPDSSKLAIQLDESGKLVMTERVQEVMEFATMAEAVDFFTNQVVEESGKKSWAELRDAKSKRSKFYCISKC